METKVSRDGRQVCQEMTGKWVVGILVARDNAGRGGYCDHRGAQYDSKRQALIALRNLRQDERAMVSDRGQIVPSYIPLMTDQ